MESRIKSLKAQLRNYCPSMSGESLRGWLVDFGIVGYEPGPWTKSSWDTAYDNGQLDYFSGLSERSRYSVLLGYLTYLQESNQNMLGHVLDIGCGNGVLYSRAADIQHASWTGIDLSTIAIEEAQDRADKLERENATFYSDDLLNTDKIPMDTYYDVIIINEVLNMSDNPKRILELCQQALRPDGFLVISAWRHRGDRGIWKMTKSNFRIIDSVTTKTKNNRLAPRGWKIALLLAKDS